MQSRYLFYFIFYAGLSGRENRPLLCFLGPLHHLARPPLDRGDNHGDRPAYRVGPRRGACALLWRLRFLLGGERQTERERERESVCRRERKRPLARPFVSIHMLSPLKQAFWLYETIPFRTDWD